MSRRSRWLFRIAGGFFALLLILAITGYFVIESDWFFNKVRERIIAEVETATGGRVELGRFHFDRTHLVAHVEGFVLHGTEPADKPPLFRAASVTVKLKLLSIIKPNVDILSLDVAAPHVYLVIAPDGHTNIPEPKIKHPHKRNTIETILDLAIDDWRLHEGEFEIEDQGKTPLDFHGHNLAVQLAYAASGPRYHGTIASGPLDIAIEDYGPEPFTMNLDVSLEPNRIAITKGHFAHSQIAVDVTGALEDLRAPHARFEYKARAAVTDIARIFRLEELKRGTGTATGVATWNPEDKIVLTGEVHGEGVEFRDESVDLAGIRADGKVHVAQGKVEVRGLAVSGDYVRGDKRERTEGKIAEVDIRGKDVDVRGVALGLLGGTFNGAVTVRKIDAFTVTGDVVAIQAQRTVRMYSPESLPWDALVSGPVNVEGSLKRHDELRARGDLTISPALSGDPVSGHVSAMYDAASRSLDLGRSAVSLPHSRVEASGVIGRELRVHLETRDLRDLLPALGQTATDVPITFHNGSAVFDGSVTGDVSTPRIAGHLRATNVAYTGESVDLFEGDVTAAPDLARVQAGTLVRGSLRAQVQGSVVLSAWKTNDTSPIAGNATIRNAALADLLAIAKQNDLGATGTLSATGFVSGTIGAPRIEGDLEVTKGEFRGEPFDRIIAHGTSNGHAVEIARADITAGAKQVHLSGTYDAGRVRFDLNTNAMPLDAIHTLVESRPGLSGTVQATARGELQGERVITLNGDVNAKGLQINEQPVGDAHLTVQSQGLVLTAHLESTAAGSTIRGDGQWRLEGDYPGSARISFSKLDLANLRAWISASQASRLSASAEGELQISGPARNWTAMTAELRIPNVEIGPAPDSDFASSLLLHNQGPIVARYANSVVTVESAHLIGRGTDLAVAGKVAPNDKQPLDLRVEGHADLGFLGDFVPDVIATGTVVTNATVRGAFSDPQIVGRMEFQKAAFNIVDVPNGISNATGAVTFTKDRATIQTLTGETGGGKIDLSGFVGYGGGQPIVFRLHARAREVRVRYPEGVSTVANASLNFTGTEDSSTLSGNITILRTGINLQSDFSSILAKSAEPVRTPSAPTGILGGMSFDVQIETSPETQFESSLTEGIQAEASLRVRGTISNPAVLGRISITQGKLTFFGTQYTLTQGTVSFFNPVKIEPILNIDLETKARGIDITLSVSGPLNKLTLTPRSDPPLQFSEIVALLAQGRTPTSDPSLLRQQTEAPQTFQQAGASALLGSAIANPVAGRLQRFFGVSKLRIDPSLSGVENNPQARLTLEQQITPSITFTYITNVTTSNPQVVRVEWAVSKTWSVVALREENGLLGVDFFYKKRVK